MAKCTSSILLIMEASPHGNCIFLPHAGHDMSTANMVVTFFSGLAKMDGLGKIENGQSSPDVGIQAICLSSDCPGTKLQPIVFLVAIIVLTKKSRHSTPRIYLDACSHSLIGTGTALVIKCTADFTSAYCLL